MTVQQFRQFCNPHWNNFFDLEVKGHGTRIHNGNNSTLYPIKEFLSWNPVYTMNKADFKQSQRSRWRVRGEQLLQTCQKKQLLIFQAFDGNYKMKRKLKQLRSSVDLCRRARHMQYGLMRTIIEGGFW